jgi:hypothetical protein
LNTITGGAVGVALRPIEPFLKVVPVAVSVKAAFTVAAPMIKEHLYQSLQEYKRGRVETRNLLLDLSYPWDYQGAALEVYKINYLYPRDRQR